MNFKKALYLGIMSSLFIGAALKAADSKWMDDFEAAKVKALKENKLILADFSGSDWCGWCMKLDKEVFSQKAFTDFAEKHFVLLLVDTPKKSKLPEKVQKQNTELKAKYNVEGFPTVLILKANGDLLESTGYQEGGAENYVKYLKGVVEKHANASTKKTEKK
ncbi:MAG: hypothetical protein A2X49_05400 [Lentisphaerae bacterium GWF2_52_8]|nr:MAG: hypothetical protein A2X49_05400 [Lentisphaerae bacterium GWF2_52_8]